MLKFKLIIFLLNLSFFFGPKAYSVYCSDILTHKNSRAPLISIKVKEGEKISTQQVREVEIFIRSTFRSLYEFELPKELEVTLVSKENVSMAQAYTKITHGKNEIIVTPAPEVIAHELGHILFDHNLLKTELDMIAKLKEFNIKFSQLQEAMRILKDEGPDKRSEFITESPLYSKTQPYYKLISDLKTEFSSSIGLPTSHLWLIYAELFSDTLAYVSTGNPKANIDDISAESTNLSWVDFQNVLKARDFSAVVNMNDWQNQHPYTEQHIFFGPANKQIGKQILGKSRGERFKVLHQVFQVLVESINRASSEEVNGRYNNSPDVQQENEKLIDLLSQKK